MLLRPKSLDFQGFSPAGYWNARRALTPSRTPAALFWMRVAWFFDNLEQPGNHSGPRAVHKGNDGNDYFFKAASGLAKCSFVSFATTPDRAKMATKLGTAIRPLKVSARSHTTSMGDTQPTTMMMAKTIW